MASSVIQKLRGLADSGQNIQLQIQLRNAVQNGQINKQQAGELFAELVPIATKNEKPREPLSPSELSNLRSKISNQDGNVRAALLSRAVETGQVSKEEANEFAMSVQANRKPRGPSKDPSTANKSSAPSSQSGSSAPSSQSGSNLNRERFTELIERLRSSKAEVSSKLGKSKTPAPKVTGPAFRSVNTPVTNPDAPTNNVTKPTGAAAVPIKKSRRF